MFSKSLCSTDVPRNKLQQGSTGNYPFVFMPCISTVVGTFLVLSMYVCLLSFWDLVHFALNSTLKWTIY